MKPVEFDIMDTVIRALPNRRMKYAPRGRYYGKIAKCGQAKLLIGEIMFLLNHWDVEKYPSIVLVVAGGASGEHYAPLLDMFPDIARVDLWDAPNREFALENTSDYANRVRIIRQLMTRDTLGDRYSNENVFFISDIRTMSKGGVGLNSLSLAEHENVVADDMELQKELVLLVNPIECMLKLRVPYPPESDVDVAPFITYFKGVIYGQCFSSRTSAEMRLVPIRENGNYVFTKYGKREFEEAMMYYNARLRDSPIVYSNTINGATEVDDSQLVGSFDTCFMLYVFDKYLYSVGYDERDKNKRLTKCLSLWNWILKKIKVYQKTGAACNLVRNRLEEMERSRNKYPELYESQSEEMPPPRTLPIELAERMKTRSLGLEPTLSIYEEGPLTFRSVK